MLKEHERAILTTDLPEYHLKVSDVGIVVHIYQDAIAYEIEFLTLDGTTIDVVTVKAEQLRTVNQHDNITRP